MMTVWCAIVALCGINLVSCKKCDPEDHDCTTKGANNSFGPFVNGIDNIVEASDPLRKDLIIGNLSTIKYQFKNASMSGMKDCVVTKLIISQKKSSFQYVLECPHIVVNANCEMKGNISEFYVEGNGTCAIYCDDYVFMFNGQFEKHINEDNKTHVQVKSHNVKIEPKGRVVYDFRNLYGDDKEKSDVLLKFMNENWYSVDEMLRTPSVNSFMDLFIENLNTFLNAVPVERVIPEPEDFLYENSNMTLEGV